MNQSYIEEIIKKLIKVENRELKSSLLYGVQVVFIITVAAFVFFSLLELVFRGDTFFRSTLFFTWTGIILGSFTQFIFLPVYKRYNPFKDLNYLLIASKVGKVFPGIKDDLLNALQLVLLDKKRSGVSENLVNAAFLEIYNKSKEVVFENAVSYSKPKKLFVYTLITFILSGTLFSASAGFRDSAHRIVNYNIDFVLPQKYNFEVEPGNSRVTKGEDLQVKIKVRGAPASELDFYYKDISEAAFNKVVLTPDSLGIFSFNFFTLRTSISYYCEKENVQSELFQVEVVDNPVIRSFKLSVTPPGYSGETPYELIDNGNVSGLAGTLVKFDLTSNLVLKSAKIEYFDTTSNELKVDGVSAAGIVRLSKNVDYKIVLTDTEGNNNLSPVVYSFKVEADGTPTIELLEPKESVTLNQDHRLRTFLKISDDFGFSSLKLYYRIKESKFQAVSDKYTSVEIPFAKNLKEQDVTYIWNLTPLFLAAGDVVSFYFEVADNDYTSGFKKAQTVELTVKVPSLDEIFSLVDETQNSLESELKQVLKEAEELKKELDKIDKELKSDKQSLTWEEKDKIQQALDKFSELQEKAESMKEMLNDAKDKLAENNLLSKETMEKYLELQKMFDELSNDEMKKAMERLQKNLENMNRKQTQNDLSKLQMDEDAFQKSIERTLNLLKRIQAEQKIDELMKRAEELENKQNELNQQTEKQNLQDPKNSSELAKKQEEITKELEKLNEEMKELKDKMSEMKDMPNDKMEQANEEFEKQENEQLSEQSEQDLQKGDKQKASKQQKQISQNMKQMQQKMQEVKDAMMQQNQMQVFTDMMKLVDNILSLSKEQESIKKNTQSAHPNALLTDEMRKQDNLRRNLDKMLNQLGELAQKTFAVTPEMAKALGDSKREMNAAVGSMNERNNGSAAGSQGKAMESLNQAALQMQNSLNAMMMQGGGQGGMMSMLQQMGQLSGQQMSLNNMTQQLMQQSGGEMSGEMQGQMQRLAQQQELIRKSLEQLNKEAKESGKSKTLPGNLDNILKEMQEIVADMNTQKLDDGLVQKQEKILSRMLDAQRSINERDYEKNRESYTGTNIRRDSPGNIDPKTGKKGRVNDNLNRALNDDFSKDYEEIIRRYYEIIKAVDGN
ncbi:MAG: hypothetical protein IAE91_02305 [Ignavibacteriaceae bacterium]|nr:hypothetical protein [Ignavibacteriaceae bacterium]